MQVLPLKRRQCARVHSAACQVGSVHAEAPEQANLSTTHTAEPAIKFDNPFGETGAGLTLSAPPTDFSFFTDPSKSFRPSKVPRLEPQQASSPQITPRPPSGPPPGSPGPFPPAFPQAPGPFAPRPPPMPPHGFFPPAPMGQAARPAAHAPSAQPGRGGGQGGRGRGRGGRGRSGNGGQGGRHGGPRHGDQQRGNSGQKGCNGSSLASPAMWVDPWVKFKGMYPNCGL